MKKGDKKMKKVLFPILALILALGLTLPMATPVSASPDEVILTPMADGDSTDLAFVGATTNWQAADSDDADTSYVWRVANVYATDLYELDDVILTGTINSVTVYIKARAEDTPEQASARTAIKIGTTEDYGTAETLTTSYAKYSTTYATNPGTTLAWAWEDIDDLQAGVSLQRAKSPPGDIRSRATQVWVVVDYTPAGPAITVEKDYRYTNVCFEKDNDGDGEFNEDPSEQIDNDGDGLFGEDPIDGIDNDGDELIDEDPVEIEIDNDLDGQFSEDPVDCPDGTYLGDLLFMDGNYYLLKAVINKRNVVKSYNPGQYYAVSTVNVLTDVDMLTIEEDFSGCIAEEGGISVLNPVTGGGRLVVVQVGPGDPEAVAYQILDAKSSEVSIVDGVATVSLGAQEAGTTILVYVKFGPGLKGEEWYDELTCDNTNSAWVVADPVEEDIVSDNAMLKLVLKE